MAFLRRLLHRDRLPHTDEYCCPLDNLTEVNGEREEEEMRRLKDRAHQQSHRLHVIQWKVDTTARGQGGER